MSYFKKRASKATTTTTTTSNPNEKRDKAVDKAVTTFLKAAGVKKHKLPASNITTMWFQFAGSYFGLPSYEVKVTYTREVTTQSIGDDGKVKTHYHDSEATEYYRLIKENGRLVVVEQMPS